MEALLQRRFGWFDVVFPERKTRYCGACGLPGHRRDSKICSQYVAKPKAQTAKAQYAASHPAPTICPDPTPNEILAMHAPELLSNPPTPSSPVDSAQPSPAPTTANYSTAESSSVSVSTVSVSSPSVLPLESDPVQNLPNQSNVSDSASPFHIPSAEEIDAARNSVPVITVPREVTSGQDNNPPGIRRGRIGLPFTVSRRSRTRDELSTNAFFAGAAPPRGESQRKRRKTHGVITLKMREEEGKKRLRKK